ncbi:MAG: hypothetical protein M5U26_13145 [Planctomycetota bacterium]|nr:hypothetical protein [Planctomycetota bacterium]
MANRLKMGQVLGIEGLLQRRWSHRRIAKALSVDRATVKRYAETLSNAVNLPGAPGPGPNAASNLLTGSGQVPVPQTANLPAGSSGPASHCTPHAEQIKAKVEQGLSAQRIWQDLRDEHGFLGGYDSVKRFVRRHMQGRRCRSGAWRWRPARSARSISPWDVEGAPLVFDPDRPRWTKALF